MQTQADMGIDPVSCENCSVFKKGEGGPEAPGALRLRNKKATASVASSYSQNTPVPTSNPSLLSYPSVQYLARRDIPPLPVAPNNRGAHRSPNTSISIAGFCATRRDQKI